MQFDKQTLDRILTMNDSQLRELVARIAAEAGIDPAALGLDPKNLSALRAALGAATAEDLKQLGSVYEAHRKDHPLK